MYVCTCMSKLLNAIQSSKQSKSIRSVIGICVSKFQFTSKVITVVVTDHMYISIIVT